MQVKQNVGHAEGASGLNSLIKAVLALENNVIPPNINFNHPNPEGEKCPVIVPSPLLAIVAIDLQLIIW